MADAEIGCIDGVPQYTLRKTSVYGPRFLPGYEFRALRRASKKLRGER
jgi:hypothetical protein